MKIAFDVGGVLSRYPVLIKLFWALQGISESEPGMSFLVDVCIISDMHPKDKIIDMLQRNGIHLDPNRVFSANYKKHGENCKAVLCEELGIDILIDDFIGYVASPGKPLVRLLVMPDPSLPYYHDEWKTDGSEGNFGRRNPPGSKRPPEDR